MERQCACCATMFRPDRYHPNQYYCSKESCQRKRRTTWHKNKLKTDKAYRENQADAQAYWKAKNPDYWKNYRASHPHYVERNRQKQYLRRIQSKSPPLPSPQTDVAKMDAASLQRPVVSGRYRLISLDDQNVAKMDFAIVQLSVLEPVTKTG
jgi:transketolase